MSFFLSYLFLFIIPFFGLISISILLKQSHLKKNGFFKIIYQSQKNLIKNPLNTQILVCIFIQ